MASIRKAIGDLLVDNGQITPEELEQAEAERVKTGEPIATVLEKLGLVTENSLKNALELQYGVNYVNLSKREPETELISLLPEDVIRAQLAVPVSQQGERLTIAMVDPSDSTAVDEVKRKLAGRQLKTVVCLEEEFVKFVDKAFRPEETSGNGSDAHIDDKTDAANHADSQSDTDSESGSGAHAGTDTAAEENASPEKSGLDKPQQSTNGSHDADSKPYNEPEIYSTQEMKARPAPGSVPTEQEKEVSSDSFSELSLARRAQEEAIVLLANQILGSAIKRHCSNIHISMGARESIVHYRLNGRLVVDRKLPNTVVTALVARYKMMARLNLAERKEPQDGHIKVKSASKEIVCLISVIPTDHGESIVIWIV